MEPNSLSSLYINGVIVTILNEKYYEDMTSVFRAMLTWLKQLFFFKRSHQSNIHVLLITNQMCLGSGPNDLHMTATDDRSTPNISR